MLWHDSSTLLTEAIDHGEKTRHRELQALVHEHTLDEQIFVRRFVQVPHHDMIFGLVTMHYGNSMSCMF